MGLTNEGRLMDILQLVATGTAVVTTQTGEPANNISEEKE